MDAMNSTKYKALRILKQCRPFITGHQYRTIKGQIFAGDPEGAIRGLQKIQQGKGKE